MNIHKIFILFLLLVGVFSSCQEKEFRIPITLESFADMADVKYRVDADLLNESLRHVVLSDTDCETPDIQARRHYLDGGQLVWVTRNGISSKADTLLTYLATVDSIGFSSEKFCYSSLSSDLQRARDLDFDSDKDSRNNINKVYARLEYRLTKAFLRYVEGMRFGFVNPYDAFNRLDVRDSSGVYTSYRSLYDVPTKRPDAKFVSEAFAVMAGNDKAVGTFLAASRPENPLYHVFINVYTSHFLLQSVVLCFVIWSVAVGVMATIRNNIRSMYWSMFRHYILLPLMATSISPCV